MKSLWTRLWVMLGFIMTLFDSGALLMGETPISKMTWQSGYEKTVQGEPFPYPSLTPDIHTALLVRSNRANPQIAWETRAVPESSDDGFFRFVWIFGIDANTERHDFTLHVNHQPRFIFSNPGAAEIKDWEILGDQGARLLFKPTLIDRHEDLMGFAFLTLPAAWVEMGKPVDLKVTGEGGDSPVWYMTFQRVVTEEITIESLPALLRHKDGLRQEIQVSLLHLAEPTQVRINVPGQEMQTYPILFGPNRISILVPQVEEAKSQFLQVHVEGREKVEKVFTLEPVRPWTIFLVQHSHTDIGYTRPQTEILPEHLRYIDYALDFCDATDTYPDDARFRWTCESSWAVREYLECRPETQIERLRKRINEGRIALTAMMFNLSELTDEASFSAFLSPLRLFRQKGLTVTAAMQNDVNGMAWCLADYLPMAGVSCFVMGQHSHRALTCFKKPTAFWWESPSGSRLLGFRADHYMTGNQWGLHSRSADLLKANLFPYLKDLKEKGYPFDCIEVQYSGYLTDNAPPSLAGPDRIRAWNETYASPRLRSATVDEFMEYLSEHHGDSLPVHRAAWPDWWSDGYGSAARETAAGRRTHADLIAAQGLLATAAGLAGKT
ncbi:MAG: glycosyl hydrolase family 38, partial [Planctomycetota bacterium]